MATRVAGARSIACPGCGACWPATSTRFCGECGKALPRRGPGAAPARPPRWLVLTASGLLAGLVVAQSADVGWSGGAARIGTGADPVAVPAWAGIEAPPSGADTVPDLRLSAPCGAQGCAPSDGSASGTTVAISQRDRTVVGLDAATGTVRWETPLPDPGAFERPLQSSVPSVEGPEVQLLPSIGDGIHLSGPGWVAVLDVDGTHLWTAAASSRPDYVRRTGELVLFHGRAATVDGSTVVRLVSHDARTGAVLWEREVARLQLVRLDRDLVVVTIADDRIARLDPARGTVLWETEGASARAWTNHPDWLDVRLPDGESVAVDVRTGITARAQPPAPGAATGN